MILNRNFFIDIHSHQIQEDQKDILTLVNRIIPEKMNWEPDCEIFFSAGVHPWYSGDLELSEAKKYIYNLAEQYHCLAIGECGFDLLKGPSVEIQEKFFDVHYQLSEELKIPLIIHCVRAYNLLLSFKKNHPPTVPWIIHGYNSNLQIANELVKQGIYLSFGKSLTFMSSNACKVLPLLPPASLFLETDDQKVGICNIYQAASGLMNIDINHLKEIIFNNFKNCFRISL